MVVIRLAAPAALFPPRLLSHIVLNLLGVALGIYFSEITMFATLLEDSGGDGFIGMAE